MKLRSLALCCAVAAFSLPMICQADNFLGAGLGVNFSSLTNATGFSGNTEFQGGAFADWGLGNIWYVETGLRYNSYGTGIDLSALGLGSASTDVHYLEIPILAKPTFDAGGWYPYLLAGPNLGIKVGESNDDYNTIDFSLDFGAGAEVPIAATFRAFLQFDYSLGLVNVVNGGDNDTRGANLTVGAMMPF